MYCDCIDVGIFWNKVDGSFYVFWIFSVWNFLAYFFLGIGNSFSCGFGEIVVLGYMVVRRELGFFVMSGFIFGSLLYFVSGR